MKKTTRIIAILLMLVMVITIAACNEAEPPAAPEPADDTAAPADNAAPEPPPPPPVVEQDVQADGIEDGASLVYWSMWSETEPQAIAIQAAADMFADSTGVQISINFNGRQGQREGVGPALTAGETIDIFDEDIDRVTTQWGDHLMDLTEFVNSEWSDTNGQPYRNLVNNTLMNMAFDKSGGKYSIIPYQPFIFTTMYNKDLFAQAGITSVPTNWEQFLDVCQKLVDAGITPLTVDNAYIPANFGYTLTRVAGVERTMEIFATKDLSDPSILRVSEIFEELVDRGFISQRAATNVFPEGQAGEFAMETVAMILCGTWLPNELKELNDELAWGSFAWPSIDAGGAGPEAHNIGAQCFGINRNTEYPNAAFAFIRWMTLGHWDQVLATDTMGVPMANDAVWPPQLADAKAIFDATNTPFPWAAGAEDDPDITAVIIDGFQRLVAGSINAQQYADLLAEIG